MNITRVFSYLAGAAILMTSCANENFDTNQYSEKGTIRFTLGGSAKKKSTRATVADEDKESHIGNVLAVLFDKEAGFYKTVEANGVVDGQYEFNVERDGSYDIYFVANADSDLKAKLQGITAGTKITDSDNVLETIVATQQPDADNWFLMLSTAPASVDKIAIKDERDLGTISMKRLAARFDIVNKAPGITITGISFKNRVLKSAVSSPNTEPTDISEWYEDRRYDSTNTESWPTDFKCESEESPVAFAQTVYSYENFSGTTGFSDDYNSVIEIEYLDEDGKTKHTHEVTVKDQVTGESRAIQRNHLYRITLHGKYDLNFNLEVLDWNDVETFEYSDMPFNTYTTTQQEEANNKLKVARFMDRPVLSTDVSDGKVNVTLRNSSGTSNGIGATLIFAKYRSNQIFHFADQEYRVPTAGELQLLAPFSVPTISYIKYNSDYAVPEFTENVNVNMEEYYSKSYYTNPSFIPTPDTFSGKSEVATGAANKSAYVSGTSEYAYFTDETSKYKVSLRPVYGLRFRGTDQFAAYKWEVFHGNQTGSQSFYTVIKIKALPINSGITMADIKDNDRFWSEGCLEYKLYSHNYDECELPSKSNGFITKYSSTPMIYHNLVLFRPLNIKVDDNVDGSSKNPNGVQLDEWDLLLYKN
ncbi:MAG: hypothetical protein K2M93_09620 [Muribaculaceae bacterium]|nr:hypothetical protein [Muribaculaceae bacterium]